MISFKLWHTLLAAALIGAGGIVAAQLPTSRPIESQPDDVAAVNGVTDPEDPWPAPEEPPILTTAADLRAQSPEQAATGRPVRIRGVVTYLAAVPSMMFVQDPTGGVCVSAPRDPKLRAQLRYGTLVQVQGVTADGGLMPYVTAPGRETVRVEVLESGRPPRPRLATIAQLGSSALHGELIEVEGVVRSVHTDSLGPRDPAATVITLARGEATVEAVVFGRSGESIVTDEFVGAVVGARGVFNAAASERHAAAAMRLLLRSARDLTVRRPATPPRDLPMGPISAIDASTDTQPSSAGRATRVRVQGVVTLVLPGRGIFIQDGSGAGIWLEPPAADARAKGAIDHVRPTDRIEVIGFPSRRGWSSVIADAVWRVTGGAPLPDAPLVTPEQGLAAGMNARLVRISGQILSVARLSDHTTLVLQSGGRVFLARLVDPAAKPPSEVRDGSWVCVTGVCVQNALPDGLTAGASTPTAPDAAPHSFHLLLAGPDAVQIIGEPGWWTPQRVLVAVSVLAAAALASFAWVMALQRRVAHQTTLIREHLAKRTLYEERVRIARDLHDSLEQDLLGITLQLNATDKLLAQPEQARRSLLLAAAMVRRSQAETHRAVWDLRERRPGQEGLVPRLREAVTGLAPRLGADQQSVAGAPQVEVNVVGEPQELPPQLENHLLRVALEAVTNAVKHAAATRIDIDITFAKQRVELRVRDDGRGFDAESLPPPTSGHFGLFGMRERADKLNAELLIRSRPGGGTEIRLEVPLTVNGTPTAHASSPLTEAVRA